MNSNDHPELQTLKLFAKGLRDFAGRGGSRMVAGSIGMEESAFSRFINDPERTFDRKTLLCYALMQELRAKTILGAEMAAEGTLGPLIFREWKMPNGELRYTWTPKEQS